MTNFPASLIPGELAAAINATMLAVINAGIPTEGFLTSCSAGFLESTPVVGTYL